MQISEFMLAAMSSAGQDPFSPVQVQKLFFVFDMKIPSRIGGPFFNFEPHHYGPFDKNVYLEIEKLKDCEMAEIHDNLIDPKVYRLTYKGYQEGRRHFKELPDDIQEYVEKLVQAIRSMSFSQLVSTIYSLYPDMRKNSVFSSR